MWVRLDFLHSMDGFTRGWEVWIGLFLQTMDDVAAGRKVNKFKSWNDVAEGQRSQQWSFLPSNLFIGRSHALPALFAQGMGLQLYLCSQKEVTYITAAHNQPIKLCYCVYAVHTSEELCLFKCLNLARQMTRWHGIYTGIFLQYHSHKPSEHTRLVLFHSKSPTTPFFSCHPCPPFNWSLTCRALLVMVQLCYGKGKCVRA